MQLASWRPKRLSRIITWSHESVWMWIYYSSDVSVAALKTISANPMAKAIRASHTNRSKKPLPCTADILFLEIVVKNCASMPASRSLLYACPEETPLCLSIRFRLATHALHTAPLLWCPVHLLLSHFPYEYVYCSSRDCRRNVIHRK